MNGERSAASLLPAAAVLGVCIAIGLIIAGYFAAAAIMESHRNDRSVTVQGVALREISASALIWHLRFRADSESAEFGAAKVEETRNAVQEFLKAKGIEGVDVNPLPIEIESASPTAPSSGKNFAIAGVAVKWNAPENLPAAFLQEVRELLCKRSFPLPPEFSVQTMAAFAPAETVRQELLPEAFRDARKAAARFGDVSGVAIGAVRRAVEHPIELLPPSPDLPDRRTVRVAVTVEYFLK